MLQLFFVGRSTMCWANRAGAVVTKRGHRMLATAAAAVAFAAPVMAGGAGKNIAVQKVVRGSAQFSTNGPVTTIRAADRTIINYSVFNIAIGDTVKFVQPSRTSRVLNRINSTEP